MESLVKFFLFLFVLALLLLAFQFSAENPIGGDDGIAIEIRGTLYEFKTNP